MRCRLSFPAVIALLLWAIPAYPQSVNVQPRQPSNLLLCSWNIKFFKDTGRDLSKLAQVIAHFDICGIIELQSDQVLQDLFDTLDFDGQRKLIHTLVGEIVVGPEGGHFTLKGLPDWVLESKRGKCAMELKAN